MIKQEYKSINWSMNEIVSPSRTSKQDVFKWKNETCQQ